MLFSQTTPSSKKTGLLASWCCKAIDSHEYPSIIKKQIAWNYRSTPQEPVYDFFGPANILLMHASLNITEVTETLIARSADSFGLNGRARAAEVSTKTADIAWNPQNQTADGYGPAVDSQMQMQLYQQLQEQMLRMQSAMERGLCLYMEQKCADVEKRLNKSVSKKLQLLTL